MKDKIILASASPRRKHLLETVGIPFEAIPAHVEEETLKSPSATVEHNARKKALAIASDFPDRYILGVDTLVFCKNRILGKPDDEAHAFEMLRLLNNRTHIVFSGICLIKGAKIATAIEKTKVFFDKLTEQEISNYIRTHQPMDKAGAYGIQDFSSMFIKKIEGDYFNVVGLPLNLLYRILKGMGFYM